MENIILQEIKKLSDEIKAMDTSIQTLSNRTDARFETIESKLGTMESKFETMESKLGTMEYDLNVVKRSSVTMEVDYGKKLQMLLDIYPGIFSDNIEIKKRLEEIDNTLEDHSMVIEFLKVKVLNQS